MIKVEIQRDDTMPAYGAYLVGSVKGGTAIVRLNIEGINSVTVEHFAGPEATKDWKHFIVSTVMHEVGHAMQDYLDSAFSENEVENILADFFEQDRPEVDLEYGLAPPAVGPEHLDILKEVLPAVTSDKQQLLNDIVLNIEFARKLAEIEAAGHG